MSKIIKESGPWGEITNYYYEYLDVISQRDTLRAEVERLKAEVDRDRIEIENLRRWREIAKQCAEAMKLRGQHDNFDCIHDAGNMELCQCGKTERELFAIAEKSWIEALSADAEALKK